MALADVLRIATADAAKFLREEGERGVVAVDARAALVLLNADPHEDLSALRHPLGVMVNGNWYDSASLSSKLEELRHERREAADTDSGPGA